MSGFKICIPSKGRAGFTLTQKIIKSGTFYVPNSEVEMYRPFVNKIVGVPNEIKGITKTRNWILKNNNCNVFFIDDDLEYTGTVKRDKEKYKIIRIKDEEIIINVIKSLFDLTYQMGAKLNGFFTVGNNLTNYPYNPFLFNGLCLGSCMGIINDGTYYFNEEYEVKEDYELTLRNLVELGVTVRTNIIFMQHEHTKMAGGCRDDNRIKKEIKAIKNLIKTYPGMIKSAKHRGTTFAIQLNI